VLYRTRSKRASALGIDPLDARAQVGPIRRIELDGQNCKARRTPSRHDPTFDLSVNWCVPAGQAAYNRRHVGQ
jgi:hypothetical protein